MSEDTAKHIWKDGDKVRLLRDLPRKLGAMRADPEEFYACAGDEGVVCSGPYGVDPQSCQVDFSEFQGSRALQDGIWWVDLAKDCEYLPPAQQELPL